jgi:hypothetical protein
VRAQQKLQPPQWPPPIWPPVGYAGLAPETDALDNLDDDLASAFGITPEPGTPIARAVDALVDVLVPQAEAGDDPYAEDPHGWVTDVLGEHMWSKQVQIAEAVRDHRRVAVPSCHEAGKSWLAARIVSWWLSVWPPGEAFAVTTAPSAPQVRAILWREINRAHKKGNLPGRTNQTEWWIGDELVGFGRKPADYSPTAFQGIHARRVLVVIDEACHDELTEVLTEDGWRRFSALDGSERLLTMDPETHVAEYARPARLIAKPYRGPMIEYRSRGADFCVTPDHDFLYRPKTGRRPERHGPWRKAAIGEMLRYRADYQIPRTFTWDAPDLTTHTIPAHDSDRKRFPALTVPMDAWLTFLGWYLSEGSLRWGRGRAVGVTISQRDPAVLDEIADLVHRLGFTPRRYPRDVVVNSMQLAAHLAPCGSGALTKRVPRYVGEAGARQIRLFLDTYTRGDGYHTRGGRSLIYTSSPGMADDLQELTLKSGVDSVIRPRPLAGVTRDLGTHTATSSVDGYVVSRAPRATHLKLRPENTRTVEYDGMVYCATLPRHHLLLTRRRGCAIWSGNCGVPAEIFRAANSLVANEYGRMLAIGNPDDPLSHYATICRPGSGWVVLPISAFDSPNFTGEPIPRDLAEVLVSRIYTDELAADVGEDSPIYIAKALGQFPDLAANGVVPLSFVRDCQRLDRSYAPHELLPVELGVDVGAGGDETVIRERTGRVAGRAWRRTTPDWAQAVALIVEAIDLTGASRVKIDVIGIGWGVVGRLRELRRAGRFTAEIVAVDVRAASYAPQKYHRLRDQLWWEIGRELSRSHGWDLSALDDSSVDQLISPTWDPDSSGRVVVEPKSQTRKRLKRSPDDADALLLAFYVPPRRTHGPPVAGGRRGRLVAPGRRGGAVARLSRTARPLVLPSRRRDTLGA